MKSILQILLSLFVFEMANAQLYINTDMVIQNGETLYADDTIKFGNTANVLSYGTLQSSKGIQTNQSAINTGKTGYIVSPVQSGVNTSFDLGTSSSNNRISIHHTSASTVDYQLAVRDSVYENPATNNLAITGHSINKTWIVHPLSNSSNTNIDLQWAVANEQSGFNRNNCGLAQWQSGVSNTWSFSNNTSAANNTGLLFSKSSNMGNLNAGIYYYNVGDNTNPYSLQATLNLIVFLEGLYQGNGAMTAAPFSADGTSPATIADTITVDLHEQSGANNLAYSITGTLNTNGTAVINFPAAVNSNSYYIAVRHRNSIETWSAAPVIFSSSGTSYNFSSALSQAYGDNLKDDGNGLFIIYSGDINQDGSIDFNDYPVLDISSNNGDLGYLTYDLNGDASIDFNDYPILDINSNNGIISIRP
jgi:hypothetical protein